MLLFCRCGSDGVDVKQWNGARARIACFTCGNESWLEGFTLGEFDLVKHLVGAAVDQARKHRKRSPSEVQGAREGPKGALLGLPKGGQIGSGARGRAPDDLTAE